MFFFFAKSTFFHAGQRDAEITFFHAGITFFHAAASSVKKVIRAWKKVIRAWKKVIQAWKKVAQAWKKVLFFTLGLKVMKSRIWMFRGGWELI
jgi:hypothetical protein